MIYVASFRITASRSGSEPSCDTWRSVRADPRVARVVIVVSDYMAEGVLIASGLLAEIPSGIKMVMPSFGRRSCCRNHDDLRGAA